MNNLWVMAAVVAALLAGTAIAGGAIGTKFANDPRLAQERPR